MDKNHCWTILLGLCLALNAGAAPADTVVIASPSKANPAQQLAAEELANCLGRIYPQTRFVTAGKLPASGKGILVGNDASVRSMIADADLSKPESYAVRSVRRGNQQLGVIAGADTRGTVYGVYALLEKLGCGFYLSCDALPPARTEPFSFDGWWLSSAPTVRDRIVFDWHNFLSGCSTWNLPEWNSWTAQSLKQGYNGIMVHAYGNNPMVSFTFNDKTKPVGYLSTTIKGRDWSTMHVNDVRRLFGGKVFNAPVFGADATQVPDGQRADAAQKLMRGVFAHAQQRGMDVYFADDVDTISANPQELICTLPETARFAIQRQTVGWMGQEAGKMWLANPDTSEGYRYYKAQVAALMKAYPQITCLVVWFRQGGTPWMEIKVAEMPPRWQEEWLAEIAHTPEAEKLWHAPQMFAIGKIVRAFDRVLKELGHERVQLAAGTWDFKSLAPCHRFFPLHVKLIGLDYNALHGRPQLGDDESRKVIRDVAAHRPVIPVIWAHHDDGNYIGRPYTPFAGFGTKLADAKASGFGIIHWMTRPLDLYFKSHAEQVWAATKDRPLRATCDEMAARLFGADTRGAMGAYLERWVTDAPNFARETSDFFIDRPLTNLTQVVTGCRGRLKRIELLETAALTLEQRERVNYFKGLENFIATFFETHGRFQDAQAALKKGDLAAARAAMAECRPEPVIEQFAKFSSLGGMTRGEQGLVVSLNTRWLPHIVRLRQQLGLDAVRYNFSPTSHDPLAQASGRFTFHFDAQRQLWQTLGEEETAAQTFIALQAGNEMCRSGIESDKPIVLALRPIAGGKKDAATVPAGDYRLRLLMLDPVSKAPGQRVFSVSVGGASIDNRVDVFKETGQANRALERVYPITVGPAGKVVVTLTPVRGKAIVCGAVLEPATADHAPKLDVASLCPSSLVSQGEVARLQRAMVKARRGGKVTVAVIGGSITQGASARKPENRYGNLVAAWWREKFPKAQIGFVNAGIGATGSNYGALRAKRDLLAQRPDFVVVEYAVNDAPGQEAAETLEGLTRQILRQPNQPATLLLFMMHKGGGNAQEWHAKLGKHYALPMVSFRDALWPEIKADRLKWETVMADQVHPNNAGHECAAKFVIHLLEKVLKELPTDDRLPAVAPVPAPLFTDLFEHTALFEAGDLKPVKNVGWVFDEKGRCWCSDKPGSAIEFEIEGRTIYSMHFVVRRAMGKAKAQVDDCLPMTLNGWFDQTWGGYRCSTVVAKDLKPGPHRVRVELLEEKSQQSEGHKFQIFGLGAAGAR